MRVNKYLMPALVIITLLGSVWVAKAAGLWQTSGRDAILLDETGQADPEGIKGWMTLNDVSETYGIPLDDLYQIVGAGPEVVPDTELKELEAYVPGFSVSSLRTAVAAYLDGTWQPEAGSSAVEDASEQPTEVVPTPLPAATATPQPVETHVPQGTGAGQGEGAGSEIALPADGSALPGAEIKGRMTLQEVVDLCQVPLEVLVAGLGLPEDVNTQLPLRDLAAQFGIEVTTVREVVERYQAGQ